MAQEINPFIYILSLPKLYNGQLYNEGETKHKYHLQKKNFFYFYQNDMKLSKW